MTCVSSDDDNNMYQVHSDPSETRLFVFTRLRHTLYWDTSNKNGTNWRAKFFVYLHILSWWLQHLPNFTAINWKM